VRSRSFALPKEVAATFGTPGRQESAVLERVVVTRREHLAGVEAWSARDSTRLWNVFHTAYAFCAPRAIKGYGAPKWRYRRRDYEMGIASVRLLEPGETHVATRNPRSDFEVLQLDANWVTDPEVPRPVHFSIGQIEDEGIGDRILHLCARMPESDDDLEIEGLWCELREQLMERAETRTRPPTHCPLGVRRAREYVHQAFAERISLGEVARVTGLSKFHLDRSFRQCLGIPIHRYLLNVRLAHAQTLLRSGRRLDDVASRTGFFDASHLSRAFNAAFGITPGAYRARHRGRKPKSRDR
jgi:AraC-like DNA-binding protein